MYFKRIVQLFLCLSFFNVWIAISYYNYSFSPSIISFHLPKQFPSTNVTYSVEPKGKKTTTTTITSTTTAATTTTTAAAIILCFPFHNELDILHLKLLTLASYVHLFVIAESAFDDRGRPKALIFNRSKHEERFLPFHGQIVHIIDKFVPQARDHELGWKMNRRMKQCIGERIVDHLMTEYPDSIVIMGDADEVPSPPSVQWLAQYGCARGVTYKYASTMPTYYYGFLWVASTRGYSTLTARSMHDEVLFWKSQQNFHQVIMPLPFYPSGWHCSYCMSSEACVQKLAHTNLADGPPFLGIYNWTPANFDDMRTCGVTGQGLSLSKNTDSQAFFWVKQLYPYLIPTAVCEDSVHLHLLSSLARD
jgi:hypothetical protein